MIVSISFLINLSVEKKKVKTRKNPEFFHVCLVFLTVWFFRIFLFFFFLPRVFVVFGVINMVLASFAEGGLLDHSIY